MTKKIIIGREEGKHRLQLTCGDTIKFLGQPDCVPRYVSHKHCEIKIDDNGSITVENLKEQNVTFVDGLQIDKKKIAPTAKLELGASRFKVDLPVIMKAVGIKAGETEGKTLTYSLEPLEKIWEQYEQEKLELQLAEQKRANLQRLQGLLSMGGMLIGTLDIGPARFVLMGLAFLMGIYFFLRGQQSANSLTFKLRALDEKYRSIYKCPNPNCDRPFANQPYFNIKFLTGCPSCKCKYIH